MQKNTDKATDRTERTIVTQTMREALCGFHDGHTFAEAALAELNEQLSVLAFAVAGELTSGGTSMLERALISLQHRIDAIAEILRLDRETGVTATGAAGSSPLMRQWVGRELGLSALDVAIAYSGIDGWSPETIAKARELEPQHPKLTPPEWTAVLDKLQDGKAVQ